jgi:hypothetical protein
MDHKALRPIPPIAADFRIHRRRRDVRKIDYQIGSFE